MSFGSIIIDWYHEHKRDLPWRNTRNPYRIWLSEIILQQTRVDQGLDYYNRFVRKYPDVKKLAAAKEDEVLKLWQGLGYYSRARNLHHASKEIVKKYGAEFPSGYDDIRSLKGVGEYTAAAIASFAFGKKYPVVDGNVFRLLSRYLGIKTPVNSSVARKEFTEAAQTLMEDYRPELFNQAIMEFGALQCKPKNPDCEACPLKQSCFAFEKKSATLLPVKTKKLRVKKRYFNYLYITHKKEIHLRKRTGNDIWKNMYDLPLIETDRKISAQKLLRHSEWKKHFSDKKVTMLPAGYAKHQLTHQTIHASFYHVTVSSPFRINGIKAVSREKLGRFAVPKLIENFFQLHGLHNPKG